MLTRPPPNPRMGLATEQERNPSRINVTNVAGMGTATVRWIVRGNGPFRVTVDSEKGGVDSN